MSMEVDKEKFVQPENVKKRKDRDERDTRQDQSVQPEKVEKQQQGNEREMERKESIHSENVKSQQGQNEKDMGQKESVGPENVRKQQKRNERDMGAVKENAEHFGMKKYIVITIIVFITGFLIPILLENQESIEFLYNNDLIPYHKRKRIIFDELSKPQLKESVGEHQPHVNQNVNSENSNAKHEKLLSEICGEPVQDYKSNKSRASRYLQERDLKDVIRGIPSDQFNITVHEIGEFLKLSDDLVKVIVRSEKLNDKKRLFVFSNNCMGKHGLLFGEYLITHSTLDTVDFKYSMSCCNSPSSHHIAKNIVTNVWSANKVMEDGVSNDLLFVQGHGRRQWRSLERRY